MVEQKHVIGCQCIRKYNTGIGEYQCDVIQKLPEGGGGQRGPL